MGLASALSAQSYRMLVPIALLSTPFALALYCLKKRRPSFRLLAIGANAIGFLVMVASSGVVLTGIGGTGALVPIVALLTLVEAGNLVMLIKARATRG